MGPPWCVSGQGSRGGRGGHALTRHRPHQGGGLVDGDCIEDDFTVAEHRTFHDVGGRSCERSRQGGRIVHRCKVVGLGGGGWGSGLCRPPQCVCPPCDATAAWQCVQSSCGSVAVGRCALSRVRTGRRVRCVDSDCDWHCRDAFERSRCHTPRSGQLRPLVRTEVVGGSPEEPSRI